MLTAAFPKLNDWKLTRALRAFFRSFWWPLLVALLMAASEIFGLEFPVFYIYLVLGVVSALFTEDAFPILPLCCCIYMCFSTKSIIGEFGKRVLNDPAKAVQFLTIIVVAAVFAVGKLVISATGRKHRVPRLLLGFGVLGIGYVLSGLLSPYYNLRTVFFGFTELCCMLLPYLYFYFGVDWEKTDKSAIFTVFTCIGVGILAEIVGMYFRGNVVVDGAVIRGRLYVGWGVYNFIGCIMAMCLAAPFYFAATKKHGWLFAVLGCIFFGGVIITQSRGSILFGAFVFLACAVASLVKAEKKGKIGIGIVLGSCVLLAGLCLLVLHGPVAALFKGLIDSGSGDAGRFAIYKNCWNVFKAHPVFGEGWYRTPGAIMTENGSVSVTEAPAGVFLPPRAHDTVFQLLATGGVFALLCYLFHRFTTLWVLFRRPTYAKTMAFLAILALLLTSLLDCNFFNLGPGVLYGCLLVAAEGSDRSSSEEKKETKERDGRKAALGV